MESKQTKYTVTCTLPIKKNKYSQFLIKVFHFLFFHVFIIIIKLLLLFDFSILFFFIPVISCIITFWCDHQMGVILFTHIYTYILYLKYTFNGFFHHYLHVTFSCCLLSLWFFYFFLFVIPNAKK